LFDVETDVLVPGARTGVVDELGAERIHATAVVPAANVPYTTGGLATLRERGVAAHADFICNAGAVIGYRSRRDTTPEQLMITVDERITALVSEAMDDPEGPFAGACVMAERFLRAWRGGGGLPPGPPLA
jgi:glutamate dehydrogenase (NAD(P)+)